jgi:hypothetical protein
MPSVEAFRDAVAAASRAPIGRIAKISPAVARFYECSCQVGNIAAYIVDHGGPLDVASALFDFPEAYLHFTGGATEPYAQPHGIPRDILFILAEQLQNSLSAGAARTLIGEATEEGSILNFGSKAAAREGLSGDAGTAANRFFRDATSKSIDFQAQELGNGGYRLQFFSPANNPGYGKLYVQEIDAAGNVIKEFKNTLGPDGLIETKWVHGGP